MLKAINITSSELNSSFIASVINGIDSFEDRGWEKKEWQRKKRMTEFLFAFSQ